MEFLFEDVAEQNWSRYDLMLLLLLLLHVDTWMWCLVMMPCLITPMTLLLLLTCTSVGGDFCDSFHA